MVVPIALDDAAQAAIDAAQASESGESLIAPRLEDRYPSHGVIAKILQVGRIAGGGTAAVVRGERRAHIGARTCGPGAALWVEVTEVPDEAEQDSSEAQVPTRPDSAVQVHESAANDLDLDAGETEADCRRDRQAN